MLKALLATTFRLNNDTLQAPIDKERLAARTHGLGRQTLPALAWLVIAGVLLAACAPVQNAITHTPTAEIELVQYQTATASVTPTPPNPATSTPLPSPTPTPVTYTVKPGDSFLGIALLYKISVAVLQSANPKVNPNSMSVGTVLIIPVKTGPAQPPGPASPTPAGVTLGKVHCAVNRDGGIWCFVPVYNGQSSNVESVSAIIRIAAKGSAQSLSQPASAPLDLIPGKGTLALEAYFPPSAAAAPDQASAELLTALPVASADPRYLPVKIAAPQFQVNADGLSAQVSGKLTLNASKAKASQVWVAAVAYDHAGEVVGLRRWESAAPLTSGAGLSFAFDVYSIDETVTRVDVLAEAKP
ncbi:MAG: LysM domain-containing protein [Anaerolineaceae bacterium]|nr:LysM domain-containing protein [Anaerolineaceae bacterium]